MAAATCSSVTPGCCALSALAISVATSCVVTPGRASSAEAMADATSSMVTPGCANKTFATSEATSWVLTPGWAASADCMAFAMSSAVTPWGWLSRACCTIAEMFTGVGVGTGVGAGSSPPQAITPISSNTTGIINRNLCLTSELVMVGASFNCAAA